MPGITFGDDNFPLTLNSDNIVSSSYISAEGNAKFIATNSIKLKTGFTSKDGSVFSAKILGIAPPIYEYISYTPNCVFQFDYYAISYDCGGIKNDSTEYYTNLNDSSDCDNQIIPNYQEPETHKYFNDKIIFENSVFPNPFTDYVYVTINENNWNNNTNIIICDILGNTVYKKSNIGIYETINLSNLNTGIYFLKLNDNSKNLTFKIIKQ
jgi:hypothetical protein